MVRQDVCVGGWRVVGLENAAAMGIQTPLIWIRDDAVS